MEKIKHISLLFIAIITCNMVKAVSETENNNLWNQANAISLNATATGTCTATGDVDWWRITSSNDGNLSINCTVTNALYTYFQLYDTLGVTYFNGSFTNTNYNLVVNGLAAGTYYLKIFAYTASQSPAYSFVPVFTTTGYSNDAEPNNAKTQAKTLPLNASKVGHISYYFNGIDDDFDWYKITTNDYGSISWSITSHNAQNVYAELFDNDGVTFLGGGYTAGTTNYTIHGLAAGIYYIRIRTYYSYEYAPYTVSNSFTGTGLPDDIANNDVAANAVNVNLSDTSRGHIGYRFNGGYDDLTDWYKFTTNDDGYIGFTMYSLNGQNVYLQLFYDDTTTYIAGNYTAGNNTWSVNGIKAGTYYLRVKNYYNYEFAPYKFIVNHTAAAYKNDTEENGSIALAKNIGLNDSIAARIGFYNRVLKDTFDYRKITLTQYGSLTWTIASQNGQNLYAQLLDINGSTVIGGNYTTTTAIYNFSNLAPGTYYFLIRNYYTSEFTPYYLKTQFTPVVATDLEPNSTMATATTLNVNTPTNGCFGYFSNGVRDTNDWFKVTMPEDGKAVFSLTYAVAVTSNYFLEVYDAQGVNRFSQYASGGTITFTKADIRKGTYYIRIRGYYNHEYSQYLVNVNFTSTNATDAETNNTASTAKHIAGYAVRNGNIGYNAFGTATDTVDWHRMGHWGVGPMNLIIKKVANPDGVMPSINFKLYGDTTAAPLYNFDLTADSTNVSYTLAKKVYYIKLTKLGATYGGYNITANYRDTCSLVIAVTTHIPDSGCNRGTLVYDITRGVGPYVVQLYKDGVASGAPINTSGTATYNNVDGGVYYITARSSQAVDCDKASSIRAIAGTPLGIQKLQITNTTAVLRWTAQPCVDGFIMAYRIPPSLVFTFDTVPAGKYRDTIFNLTPGTRYRCKIASFVTYDGTTYVGNYSDLFSIITPLREGDEMIAENENLLVYPNPANNFIQIKTESNDEEVKVKIFNCNMDIVKSFTYGTMGQNQIQTDDLPSGIYIVQVQNAGKLSHSKIIVQH